MKDNWDAARYDAPRRRLVPGYAEFYGTVAELVSRTVGAKPRVLDLGAGTGLLSAELGRRVEWGQLTLLDRSADMLAMARRRFGAERVVYCEGDLEAALPGGPYDAVISALAIHHLADDRKRDLFRRIFDVLAPGGIFANAEQVAGVDPWADALQDAWHLDAARALGSDEPEIAATVERMKIDRCAPVADQVNWLTEAGFAHADAYYRQFRFAVLAGWKP